jgi:hypothetical protein
VVLMFACLTIGFWSQRGSDRHNPCREPEPREDR